MSTDFEVYVDLGGDVSVKFTMSEDELREHRDPHIKAIAHGADSATIPSSDGQLPEAQPMSASAE